MYAEDAAYFTCETTCLTLNWETLHLYYLETVVVHVYELTLGCPLTNLVFREISIYLLINQIFKIILFWITEQISIFRKIVFKHWFLLDLERNKEQRESGKNTNVASSRTEVRKRFEITATFFFNVTQITGAEIVNALLPEWLPIYGALCSSPGRHD